MKANIHPKYYTPATITCVCGAVLETGSTHQEMQIEICANCHPFYTGKKKVIDTTGRVDRFKKLAEKATTLKAAKPAKKPPVKKLATELTTKMTKKKAAAKKKTAKAPARKK